LKAACNAEGAARPPLAVEAVADRHHERLSDPVTLETELPAVACGFGVVAIGAKPTVPAARPSTA
jgi:hypothetical protein